MKISNDLGYIAKWGKKVLEYGIFGFEKENDKYI